MLIPCPQNFCETKSLRQGCAQRLPKSHYSSFLGCRQGFPGVSLSISKEGSTGLSDRSSGSRRLPISLKINTASPQGQKNLSGSFPHILSAPLLAPLSPRLLSSSHTSLIAIPLTNQAHPTSVPSDLCTCFSFCPAGPFFTIFTIQVSCYLHKKASADPLIQVARVILWFTHLFDFLLPLIRGWQTFPANGQ